VSSLKLMAILVSSVATLCVGSAAYAAPGDGENGDTTPAQASVPNFCVRLAQAIPGLDCGVSHLVAETEPNALSLPEMDLASLGQRRNVDPGLADIGLPANGVTVTPGIIYPMLPGSRPDSMKVGMDASGTPGVRGPLISVSGDTHTPGGSNAALDAGMRSPAVTRSPAGGDSGVRVPAGATTAGAGGPAGGAGIGANADLLPISAGSGAPAPPLSTDAAMSRMLDPNAVPGPGIGNSGAATDAGRVPYLSDGAESSGAAIDVDANGINDVLAGLERQRRPVGM